MFLLVFLPGLKGLNVFRVLVKGFGKLENLCARQFLSLLHGSLRHIESEKFPLGNLFRKKNLIARFCGEIQAPGTLHDLTQGE